MTGTKNCAKCGKPFQKSPADTTVNCPACRKARASAATGKGDVNAGVVERADRNHALGVQHAREGIAPLATTNAAYRRGYASIETGAEDAKTPRHVTYNEVVENAVAITDPSDGYRYFTAELAEGETAVNPGSTKRVLYGPSVLIYSVHPTSVNVYEFDNLDSLTDDARNVYEAVRQAEHDANAVSDQDAYEADKPASTERAKNQTADLIEVLAEDDNVTTVEATAVIAWVREWASDCEWAELDADDFAEMASTDLLKFSHRHIDGGLAFVLADVRRVATEPAKLKLTTLYSITPTEDADVFTVSAPDGMSGSEACRVVEEAHEGTRRSLSAESITGTVESGAAGARGWTVRTEATQAPLSAVEESAQVQALRAGATALRHRAATAEGLQTDELDRRAFAMRDQATELDAMADKLSAFNASHVPPAGGCQDEDELDDFCDCGTVRGDNGGYVLHDIGGHPDCTGGDEDPGEDDNLCTCGVIEHGLAYHTHACPAQTAIVASRIAREAADGFTFDPDSEDEHSAAQRVADILKDLSPADVPAFMLKVFGLPIEQRHDARELDRITLHGDPSEDWARWHELRASASVEKGSPDVARVLLFEYRDVIEPLAFAGHYATLTFGKSTNLSAWGEAWQAWTHVQALRVHAFGGYSLDGMDRHIDALQETAIAAALDALRWASFNNANPEPIYQDEPRAE